MTSSVVPNAPSLARQRSTEVFQSSGAGRSAGFPSGAPLSAQAPILAISSSLREGSFLSCWMPMFVSIYQGGMTPARGPRLVRIFIALTQGRACW